MATPTAEDIHALAHLVEAFRHAPPSTIDAVFKDARGVVQAWVAQFDVQPESDEKADG